MHSLSPLKFPLSLLLLLLSHIAGAQSCNNWGNFTINLRAGNKINIGWLNNESRTTSAYNIEASYDGKKFTEIGSITGLQNYENNTPYSFDHETPLLGMNYYRIKRTMTNGDTCYSKILTLFLDAAGIQTAEMYPNPAQDYLRISFFASRFESVKLTFYDLQGQIAFQEVMPVTTGKNILFYNVEHIVNGWYSVELKNKEVAIRQTIQVHH
jgi:Secretion system C-terminal sorting domain